MLARIKLEYYVDFSWYFHTLLLSFLLLNEEGEETKMLENEMNFSHLNFE